jgi:hypothetical protein
MNKSGPGANIPYFLNPTTHNLGITEFGSFVSFWGSVNYVDYKDFNSGDALGSHGTQSVPIDVI